MNLLQLREPQLNHIANSLKKHEEETGCEGWRGFLDGFGSAADVTCGGTCIPFVMFLYNLVHNEANEAELAALAGGPTPTFLIPGEWEKEL